MADAAANPYVGPRTFTYVERERFFGREREARDLLSLVIAERLVLFYAQSGAGKSSLLNTRLIPQLKEAGYAVLPMVRVGGELPEGVSDVDNIFVFNCLLHLHQRSGGPWRFAHMTLKNFLSRLTSLDGETYYYDDNAEPAENVDVYEEPLHILIIDQFEEIVTTHLERWQEREMFFRQLEEAMAADPLLWVVLTLREDYVAALDPYAGLLSNRLRARFYMQRMGYEAALEAVRRPAQQYGRPFAPGVAETLVDNLRQILVRDMPATGPGQFVEPVQLQVACYQLWKNLQHREVGAITTQDLLEAGDVDTALASFYEEALASVLHDRRVRGVTELAVRQWFDQSLITEAGTRGMVYRGETHTAELPNLVVQLLEDRYVLRSEIRSGGLWYELIHDRFVEPIARANRAWWDKQSPLMREAQAWQEANHDKGKLYLGPKLQEALVSAAQGEPEPVVAAFLAASAAEQHELDAREAARQSKLRQVRRQLAMALIGLGIAIGLVLWVSWERKRAETALTETQKARTEAEHLAQAEATARTQAERLRLEAIVQALVAQPLRLPDERSALLARQAYLFNKRGQGRALDQIDAALRTVLNTLYFSHTLHIQGSPVLSADYQTLAAIDDDGTIRIWDWRQPHAAPTVLHGAPAGLGLKALSPDGQTLAMISLDPKRVGPGDFGGPVLLWDLRQPQAAPTALGVDEERFISVVFSPDGQTLAAGSFESQRRRTGRVDSRVKLWNVRQPDTAPAVLDIPGGVISLMRFSPDGQTLATISTEPMRVASGQNAGTLRLWNLPQPGDAPTVLGSAEEDVVSVEFSPDGRTLATRHAELQKLSVKGMDIQQMGAEGLGRTIQLWDLQQREANPIVLRSPEAPFSSMAFSPDGQTLAIGNSMGSVRLWDLRQPHTAPTVLGTHDSQVNGLWFSPDGNTLISSSEANIVRIWELRQAPPTFTVLRGHTGAVSSIAFSSDGNTLVSGGKDNTVRLWNPHQPDAPPTVLSDYKAPVLSVAFSPDSRWLATGGLMDAQAMHKRSLGDTLWLWSLYQPDAIAIILSDPGGPVTSVAFSPDSQQLATATFMDFSKISAGHRGGSVRLWNPRQLEAGSIILDIPETIVLSVAFSPEGQRLATNSMSGPVRLWDIHQRKMVFAFPDDPQSFTLSIAFSPEGQQLAASKSNGIVQLLDLRQPEADPIVFPGGGVPIYAVAFSPDGQWLATGSFSNVVRLWDLRQPGDAPIVLRGHEGPVFSVAFSPDGTWLATGSDDQTIRLWTVRTADLANRVCERVWRNLTLDEWRQFVAADFPYEQTCPNLPIHPSVLAKGEKRARADDVHGTIGP